MANYSTHQSTLRDMLESTYVVLLSIVEDFANVVAGNDAGLDKIGSEPGLLNDHVYEAYGNNVEEAHVELRWMEEVS